MRVLENITYDELNIGDYATFSKTLTEDELVLFAAAAGDVNPVFMSPELASQSTFKEKIGHGMWASSLITTALGSVIPGPGTIHLEQQLKFDLPVKLGDTLTVRLVVNEKAERNRVIFNCEVTNQDAELVVSGDAKVIAPHEKISLDTPVLPRIIIQT